MFAHEPLVRMYAGPIAAASFRNRAFVRSIGGRAWNIDGSRPAGWDAAALGGGCGAAVAGLMESSCRSYGFQKFPPITSAISTL